MAPSVNVVYALRVDLLLPLVLTWLSEIGASGFGVRETVDGANEHWHFFIRSDKKEQALRKGFLKSVPGVRGNGGYSLAMCRDEERYERYLCKGNSKEQLPELIWSHGFDATADRIQKIHDEYWNENAAFERRKRKLPVMDSVLATCKEARVKWEDRTAIADKYIRELVSRAKPINLFSVRTAINSIQVGLCANDEAIAELVSIAARPQ